LQTNVYSLNDEAMGQLTRIRGAGFLSDPNDLAQILLIAIPLAFVAWRRGREVVNFFVVLVPVVVLLWTTYLTHSRGGLIALAAVALMAARKKLGTAPSLVLATVMIFGMLALDFTGGRGISAADGTDRLEAWANGLEMFKSAPLFGIGFNGFTDFHDITAHNSFVLCLAELGLLGSVLWTGLLVTTTTNLNSIIGVHKKRPSKRFLGLRRLFESCYIYATRAMDREPTPSVGTIALGDAHACEVLPAMVTANATKAETKIEDVHRPKVPRHWVVAMRLALVSFMTTAWFLSRSYTITMYLVLGLATAAINLQWSDGKGRDRRRWIFPTLTVEVLMIVLIYGLVRFRH